jgi:hypothetical protein
MYEIQTTCSNGGIMASLQMESVDRTYKCNELDTVRDAISLASSHRLPGFKLYNKHGNFIREYGLFDGKYRKVAHEENLNV